MILPGTWYIKKTLYEQFKDKNDLVNEVIGYEFKCEHDTLCELFNSKSNAIEQLLIMSKHIASKSYNRDPSFTYDVKKYYPQIWESMISQRNEYILDLF